MKLIRLLLVLICFVLISCERLQKSGSNNVNTSSKTNKENSISNIMSGSSSRIRQIRESTFSVIEGYGNIQKVDKFSFEVFFYDEKGRLTQRAEYDVNTGERKPYYIYKYNENDSCIEVIHFDSAHQLVESFVSEFDSKGYKIREYRKIRTNEIIDRKEFKYDNVGNRIEILYFVGVKYMVLFSRTINKFNSNRQLIVTSN